MPLSLYGARVKISVLPMDVNLLPPDGAEVVVTLNCLRNVTFVGVLRLLVCDIGTCVVLSVAPVLTLDVRTLGEDTDEENIPPAPNEVGSTVVLRFGTRHLPNKEK